MSTTPTPQPQKMSMDDFANSIKAKYPGTYDDIENEELADKVLTKYPVYRQHVDIKPGPQPEPQRPGLLKSLGSDLWSIIPKTPAEYGRSIMRVVPGGAQLMDAIEAPQRVQHYEEQKKSGYSLPYRAITPVAENLGINVGGEEQSAREGDVRGVVGHALAMPTVAALTAGIAKGAPAIRSAVGERLPKAANAVSPDITGVFSPRLAHLQRVAGKIGKAIQTPEAAPAPAPQLEAPLSPAAEHLQNRIAIERGLREQAPFPRESEGLPEVEAGQGAATEHLHRAIQPNEMGNARLELTPRRVPGEIAPEAIRPRAFTARSVEPIPQRRGLMLKGEVLDTRPAKIGNLLNEATGGKPLAPGIPIRQQLDRAPVAPKESSVVKSHSYDAGKNELTITTHNGQTYKYADVSPDQAAEFASGSKGQALNRLKKSGSVLIEKNGQPARPIGSRTASPNDLTPILEESVRRAKSKK